MFPVGLGGAWWQGSGLAWPALAAAGLADPPGLEGVVGWRALLLGVSCSIPWVWQPEGLRAPLPMGKKPSGLSGPVPVC